MTARPARSALTDRFLADDLDPSGFGHVEHLQVAFELLREFDFTEACNIYAKGLRSLAARAGMPEKFNLTVTFAFLSLIAESAALSPVSDFETFLQANPQLMSRSLLNSWYGSDRLNSDLARKTFLLPSAADRSFSNFLSPRA